MTLSEAACHVLAQLSDVVRQLDAEQFVRPSITLSDATIGQHMRHSLEFFQCLQRGLPKGVVNYDKREHNEALQQNPQRALTALDEIMDFLRSQPENIPLLLEIGYDRTSDQPQSVPSNLYRELSYTIEHAVHHMALIKVGLREVAPGISLPADFGVAVSTLRYREVILARQD